MVATYSPVGLKSSPVIMFSKEYSRFDVSITIDDYSVESAISTKQILKLNIRFSFQMTKMNQIKAFLAVHH